MRYVYLSHNPKILTFENFWCALRVGYIPCPRDPTYLLGPGVGVGSNYPALSTAAWLPSRARMPDLFALLLDIPAPCP
jgi:hypothetical protein